MTSFGLKRSLDQDSASVGTTANTFSMFRRTRLMNTVKHDSEINEMCTTKNEINNPTDDTIVVSRLTLGQAILEALNPVQVRLTWTQMLSSIDALSDQTAIAFRDRLFALLSDTFP